MISEILLSLIIGFLVGYNWKPRPKSMKCYDIERLLKLYEKEEEKFDIFLKNFHYKDVIVHYKQDDMGSESIKKIEIKN